MVNKFLLLIFILAFAVLGTNGLIQLRLLPLFKVDAQTLHHALEPDATNDDYLRQLLSDDGVPASSLVRPAAAIRDSIGRVAASGSILFIARNNTPANQLLFLVVKGLAFPRLLRYTWCEPADARPGSEAHSALLLYGISPPAEKGSTVIPRLTLIPGTQAQLWTAYCSQ